MTQSEYEKQNAAGFENDSFMAEEFSKLITEFNIDTIIETGTYLGHTTKRLVNMVDMVHTIESNMGYYNRAKITLGNTPNVNIILGKSESQLPLLLESLKNNNVMLFLDAHWDKECPLLAELESVAKSGLHPVIAIHDFYNPMDTTMGFDSYNGQRFDWEWIKSSIENIYGDNYKMSYNAKAEGARRGVIYLTPFTPITNNIETVVAKPKRTRKKK